MENASLVHLFTVKIEKKLHFLVATLLPRGVFNHHLNEVELATLD